MVTAEDASGGATRYQLLETMRQYALDRIDERGEADTWRRRHAAHYAALAEQAGLGMKGADELAARSRVADDLDNTRAAVMWSLDSADDADQELAFRIVAAFAGEANRSASSFGVGSWAERALPAAERATNRALRADVLAAAGWSVLNSGDLERARSLALESLAGGLSPEMSAPSLPYTLLGFVEIVLGNLDAAVECTAEGCASVDGAAGRSPVRAGDDVHEPRRVPGVRRRTRGGPSRRSPRCSSWHACSGIRRCSRTRSTIQVVATSVEDPARAEPLLDQAIELVRTGGGGSMFGIMLAIRAQLRLHAGDLAGARAALREAVARTGDVGDLPQLVTVFEYSIPGLVASGAPGAAAVLGGFALDGPFAPLGTCRPTCGPHRDGALDQARAELGEERALPRSGAGARR